MNELKTTAAAQAAANATLSEISRKLGEVAKERTALENDLAAAESAILAAERQHAQALAAIELDEGSQDDAQAAEQAVQAARATLDAMSGHRLRVMTLESVTEGLTRRYHAAHAESAAINEQHRAAVVEELDRRAGEAMTSTREHIAGISQRAAELEALRAEIEAHGGIWKRGGIEIDQRHTLTPTPTAINLHREALRIALSA